MFEKLETWTFMVPGPADLFSSSWNFWSQRGYRLLSTGPTSFQGRSFYSRLGLYRVVDVSVLPWGPSGSFVQLRYRADVSEAGALGGVALAVLLFPVAVVGGAISWNQYETDFETERWAYWIFLNSRVHASPAPGLPLPQPPPPEGAPLAEASSQPPTGAPTSPASGAPTPPPAATSAAPSAACPACQKPLAGEGKFCASCGTKIL